LCKKNAAIENGAGKIVRRDNASRDAERTRTAILEAAKGAFAKRGYDNAGLREIAASAGISLALVNRYFGSKEDLFEVALKTSLDMSEFFTVDPAHFGTNAVRLLSKEPAPRQFSMIVLSASHRNALATTAKLVKSQVIKPLADWLGDPKAEERAHKIHMLCLGFYMALHFIPVIRSGDTKNTALRHWYADMIQAIVDEGREAKRPSSHK
jgi:AcrR family transcriptional regulator